jgi:hypothetical protein
MSAATAATDKISYRDLYARWEAGNWSATALDFTQDYHDWHEVFAEQERRAAIWNYSLFHYGEDWVDVTAGWEDARSALFKGKIRPSGKLKTLWRMRKVFPS